MKKKQDYVQLGKEFEKFCKEMQQLLGMPLFLKIQHAITIKM